MQRTRSFAVASASLLLIAVGACSSSTRDSGAGSASGADGGTFSSGGANASLDGSSPGGDEDSGARASGGGDDDGGASSSAGGTDGATATPLTYMIGMKTNNVANGPAQVEAWLGRPLDVAGTTITTQSYVGWDKPYTNASGALPLLEVSFPLLSIFGEPQKMDDMAEAASGAYDATYQQMVDKLAGWSNPLLSVRIGWEFNGNWYAWSNGVGTNATYANYVAAFKRVAIMLKAKMPNVLIQWCVAWGQPDPTPYWPGAYDKTKNPGGVDVVSMDFYQANISHYNDADMTSPWSMVQSVGKNSGPIVLDWMVTFAQKNNVKIALSEYGAGQPSSKGIDTGAGLDDGTWTGASIAWMNGLPPGLLLWVDWSDDEPADDIATAGANPKEQAAWKAAWGGSRFAGTWWKGATPP